MNKARSILLTTLIILFVASYPVRALLFASDKVQLHNYGAVIHDSSVIWQASYETYYQVCTNGICDIGQQFYPVTLYETKEANILEEAAWRNQSQLSHDDYQSYLQGLMNNAEKVIQFNPGASVNAEKGGSSRNFNFELATGGFTEQPAVSSVSPVIIIIAVALTAPIVLLLIRRGKLRR